VPSSAAAAPPAQRELAVVSRCQSTETTSFLTRKWEDIDIACLQKANINAHNKKKSGSSLTPEIFRRSDRDVRVLIQIFLKFHTENVWTAIYEFGCGHEGLSSRMSYVSPYLYAKLPSHEQSTALVSDTSKSY